MGFDDLDGSIQNAVQCKVSLTVALVAALILKCDIIGEFIIGKRISIAVKDLAACGLQHSLLLDRQREIILVTFAFHDLQVKQTRDDRACKQQKDQDQNQESGPERRIRRYFSVFITFISQTVCPQ